jgi:hypothetical protein
LVIHLLSWFKSAFYSIGKFDRKGKLLLAILTVYLSAVKEMWWMPGWRRRYMVLMGAAIDEAILPAAV